MAWHYRKGANADEVAKANNEIEDQSIYTGFFAPYPHVKRAVDFTTSYVLEPMIYGGGLAGPFAVDAFCQYPDLNGPAVKGLFGVAAGFLAAKAATIKLPNTYAFAIGGAANAATVGALTLIFG